MERDNNHQHPTKTQQDNKATTEANDCRKKAHIINGHDHDTTNMEEIKEKMIKRGRIHSNISSFLSNASFMKWTLEDVGNVLIDHPIPFAFALSLLYFMGVEYTLSMVPPSSPPFDVGFELTRGLQGLLARRPDLNTLFAALNTAFVGMQTTYIVWAWVGEGRPRATIAALFMFTCRGILGYATQLPLPQDFLGSGMDFPVGNVSFFLFFSGHVGGSVIAAMDMRRMGRHGLALIFDTLNVLQVVRLLATRGHYTIDLAVGVGAGILCNSLAGKYEETKKISYDLNYLKLANSPPATASGR